MGATIFNGAKLNLLTKKSDVIQYQFQLFYTQSNRGYLPLKTIELHLPYKK